MSNRIKVDWTNHIIGFLGTILGIIIALQLQDWYDTRAETKKVAGAIKMLQTELTANREGLEFALKKLQYFGDYTKAILKYRKTAPTIVCRQQTYDSLNRLYPDIFQEIIKQRQGPFIEARYVVQIDFIMPRVQTTSWSVVKSTGILNSFPQDKLVEFTYAYETLDRNFFGVTVDDFLTSAQGDPSDDSIKKLNEVTGKLISTFRMKLQLSKKYIEEILKY